MSWDVVMFGSLSVPESNLETWLTASVSAEEYPWAQELPGREVTAQTPEALLSLLADVPTAPHELFEVSRDGARISVSCFVADDPYRDTCQALALLFGSAAAFGGAGTLTFFGYQGIRFGEKLTVSSSGVTLAQLTNRELDAVERTPGFAAVNARIHERFDSLVGRPTAETKGRRLHWAVHPFTGRRVRMVTVVEAADA